MDMYRRCTHLKVAYQQDMCSLASIGFNTGWSTTLIPHETIDGANYKRLFG